MVCQKEGGRPVETGNTMLPVVPTYKELGTTKMEVPRESVNKDRSIFEKKGS